MLKLLPIRSGNEDVLTEELNDSRLKIIMNSIIRLFVVVTALMICADSFSQERLPFAVQKLIKDFDQYEKDINEKATELIKKKRLETIKSLDSVNILIRRRRDRPDSQFR